MQKEGAICSAHCREREQVAGKGGKGNHLQKKRAQYAVRSVRRGRNLQEVEKEGTICKKRPQYAVRSVRRGRNLQEVEKEGTVCKERNH